MRELDYITDGVIQSSIQSASQPAWLLIIILKRKIFAGCQEGVENHAPNAFMLFNPPLPATAISIFIHCRLTN
jgi:hypothetical protein